MKHIMKYPVIPLLAASLGLIACKSNSVDSVDEVASPKAFRFEMTSAFNVQVPEGTETLKAWFAMPQRDEDSQKIEDFNIECPHPHKFVKDQFGNEFILVELSNPSAGNFDLSQAFKVTRTEIKVDADPTKVDETAEGVDEKYLMESANVTVTPEIAEAAKEAVGDEKNPVKAARKLYDWTLANIDYWVKDPANKKSSGIGSSTYTFETKTGNCTDFHSLWVAMARSQGIPSRIVYGSIPKPTLDGKDTDQSYHCWPEFHVKGIGWVPHDVAVADLYVDEFPLDDTNKTGVELTSALGYKGKDPKMVDYYFGNIDERRVTWNRGRGHLLEGASSAVDSLPKAYVEINGKPSADWTRKLTYKSL
jgi:transglutaminase-like putative cysteine protease